MPKRKAVAKRSSAEPEVEADPKLKARGERMKAVRELAGFDSQLSAGQVARVDSGSISVAERGGKDLTLTVAERLADAYRTSLDVLVGRAPMPDEIDEYPPRDALVRSPEFDHMPRAVTDRFLSTKPAEGEQWSTWRWARVLFDLADTFARHGKLPPPAEGDEGRRLRSVPKP